MRALIHYAFTVLILGFYSGAVCPYIAGLPLSTRLTLFFLIYGSVYLIRIPLLKRAVSNAPYLCRARRQFILEMMLFCVAGLAVSAFDFLNYQFPPASGLKVILGCLAIGFFAAIDLSLEQERKLYYEMANSGEEITISGRFVALPYKIILVATISIVCVTSIIILIIYKDLASLNNVSGDTIRVISRAFLLETIFIGTVVFIETVNLIVSHSLTVKLFFDNESKTLTAVAKGNLNSRVTLCTNDEFGLIASYTNGMIASLKERTEALKRTQEAAIITLASLAETRDNETGAHLLRTQRYVKALAEHLKDHPRFAKLLPEEVIELLYQSAPLHDIGKVGIRDAILLKPGKLTDEEFEEMKNHAIYGRNALQEGERMLGTNSFLRIAGEITYTHHEKWDGSGYPQGLKGDEIPLSGRLMALGDVYDALISKRVYKEAFPHEKAKGIIIDGCGSHFDPDVCKAFLAIEEEFVAIARIYGDH